MVSSFFHFAVDPITSPPSPFEVIGPFIAWGPPVMQDGEISGYEVKVTSATGSFVTVEKNKLDVYHLLEREDIPSDLGATTLITVQVIHNYVHVYVYIN